MSMTGTTRSPACSEVVSASVPTVRGASTTANEDIATERPLASAACPGVTATATDTATGNRLSTAHAGHPHSASRGSAAGWGQSGTASRLTVRLRCLRLVHQPPLATWPWPQMRHDRPEVLSAAPAEPLRSVATFAEQHWKLRVSVLVRGSRYSRAASHLTSGLSGFQAAEPLPAELPVTRTVV
jgi:hypothetical protein